jgi:hypothetical protein
MENARMNYYFTGIIILMLTALAFCATPAYPRNEYLNDGNTRCGEVDLSDPIVITIMIIMIIVGTKATLKNLDYHLENI